MPQHRASRRILARLASLPLVVSCTAVAHGQAPGEAIWNELSAKRQALAGAHQEFAVRETFDTPEGRRTLEQDVVLDMAGRQWRERDTRDFGTSIRVFDGSVLLSTDGTLTEYVRVTPKPKDRDPLPSLYRMRGADWSQSREIKRGPCGFPENDHVCVVLQAPVPGSMSSSPRGIRTSLDGTVQATLDTETGLAVEIRHTMQIVEPPRGIVSQSESSYRMTTMTYGRPGDASLFTLPTAGMKPVKRLSRWDASKIKRLLIGSPAPPLTVKDMAGGSIDLSAYKGKTVLLDFWTTWCPPCVSDGPALDKLHQRYGGDKLAIVGISVSEDRPVVERFLQRRPHPFPIVLTTENELPPAYQISVYPTYLVINPDGRVAAAAEGGDGLRAIEKLLKKAGMLTN